MDYSELAMEFLINMSKFHRAKSQQAIHKSMRGEFFILQYISERDDLVLPSEISTIMDISSARIAAALNNMENKGLITREIDKSDRRRILIRLTDEGKAKAKECKCGILKEAEQILSFLGEHDAKEYVRILGKLAELLTNINVQS